MATKQKLRGSIRLLMTRTATSRTVKSWYVIETIQRRQWIPVGDDKGIYRYETPQERDAMMAELAEEMDAEIVTA